MGAARVACWVMESPESESGGENRQIAGDGGRAVIELSLAPGHELTLAYRAKGGDLCSDVVLAGQKLDQKFRGPPCLER